MASDIELVLRSEHRDLLRLADRCGRASRGFQDPAADLQGRLRAHVAAVSEGPLDVVSALGANALPDALEEARAALDGSATGEVLAREARRLVEVEQAELLPILAERVPLPVRRWMGQVFRIRRDAVVRASHAPAHRQMSQTELYELARRAGVEHRSTMTQSELQAAVQEWQRFRIHDVGATG